MLTKKFDKGKAMRVGYARVSSTEQNLELQIDALEKAGCEKIYTDKKSGANDNRPGLKEALNYLREKDTLVIWKLDRLGRNLKGLIELTEELNKKGIDFQSITDKIDTSTPAGKLYFHIMAAFAEMERSQLIERTKAGLAAARKQGRVGGRPKSMTDTKKKAAQKLLDQNTSPKDVAKSLNVSVSTLYREFPASERAN